MTQRFCGRPLLNDLLEFPLPQRLTTFRSACDPLHSVRISNRTLITAQVWNGMRDCHPEAVYPRSSIKLNFELCLPKSGEFWPLQIPFSLGSQLSSQSDSGDECLGFQKQYQKRKGSWI
jgi:hypothetical protein